MVSVQFTDPAHGVILVALSAELAEHLAALLATALHSPRIHAAAGQVRAVQRDRRQISRRHTD
ncbi:hypothetical protein ABW16_13735 [Mycolicibacter heraklionensis]|uniref:Uncharacterized protein n=1 Tax=Mycolicibacter heraklionensis TaxID=512402 RepID=A0ABR5FEG1_9MYCO|nr:hypothetical protein ABW16_13735 [Mycolicibacter heraklionensis]